MKATAPMTDDIGSFAESRNTPIDFEPSGTHLSPEVRLEMFVGHLADQPSTVAALNKLVLRANASAATRSDLACLHEVLGDLWNHVR
jgi:hypothetical protein